VDETAAFVRAVDVVLFAETPHYPSILVEARKQGKAVVCIPMQEWLFPERDPWTSLVDRYLCPTRHCFDLFKDKLPCTLFEWPADTARHECRPRIKCEQFLWIRGNGGFLGRKGEHTIRKLVRLWPEIPLTILTWNPMRDLTGPNLQYRFCADDNRNIYDDSDVLLLPHTRDGIGLSCLEAACAGLPVIATHGRPWDEYFLLDWIESQQDAGSYIPNARHLETLCRDWHGKGIYQQSIDSYLWAKARSWTNRAGLINQLLREEHLTCQHK